MGLKVAYLGATERHLPYKIEDWVDLNTLKGDLPVHRQSIIHPSCNRPW